MERNIFESHLDNIKNSFIKYLENIKMSRFFKKYTFCKVYANWTLTQQFLSENPY